MKMRTISKLLATSIFALTASASQAATWEIDKVTLSWDIDSINYLPGDAKAKPEYVAYKVSDDGSAVMWGYGVQKGSKTPDYKILNRSSSKSQSALELTNGNTKTFKAGPYAGEPVKTSTLTFYNNYLGDDFYYPEHLTMDVLFSVVSSDGMTGSIADSFDLYHQKARSKKEKEKGEYLWDIEPGGGVVYIDASNFDLTTGLGTSFQDGLEVSYYLVDKNGNILTPIEAGEDRFSKSGNFSYGSACGFSGFEACFVLGGKEKAGHGQTYEVNFVISSVTSTVPEPESYAMLLAGLGMVGMVARRRRNTI